MDDELTARFGERARRNEPMSKHTTFGIGGPADVLVDVETAAELKGILNLVRAKGVPLQVIGRGANVLVPDEGIRGVVMRLAGEFRELAFDDAGRTVEAGAGVPLARLVEESSTRGFFDFCWAAGIPGTVGGAVVCNAGSWGQAMGEFVEEVNLVLPDGQDAVLPGNVVNFGYRTAAFPVEHGIVTGVTLGLGRVASEDEDAAQVKAGHLARKLETQPLDVRSAGSVFKNPPGEAAAALIDRAGCKGLRAGGAVVSGKHANFIVNEGGASAADVLSLVETVRNRVRERSGVDLELELRVL